jgi:5-methylcytosine-specific restriction protein A
VHVDLPALAGGVGGLHETDGGFVLDPFGLDQLVCDPSVSRIVFGPGSEVLDVGRKTRVIPAGLRRAVIARDRHCVAPGCGRSARWCDVHHIVSWAHGGETVIANLCLLCRYHHTLVHLELVSLDDLDIRPLVETTRST